MDLYQPMYPSFGDLAHYQSLAGTDSQPLGLSLQEMIDRDIKAEFDEVPCGNTPDSYSTMENLDLLNDFDFKLDDDELGSSGLFGGNHCWANSNVSLNGSVGTYDLSLSNNSGAFNNSYLEDMTGATSLMVNPNNVMPVHHHHRQMQQQQQQQQHNAVTQLSINTQYSNVASSHPSPASFGTHSPVIMQVHLNGSAAQGATLNRGIKTLKILPPMGSPMQQVPSPSGSLGGPPTPTATSLPSKKKQLSHPPGYQGKENGFPKPAYSYSCLIGLALKNSRTGSMSVSEIYKFMCEHFPYFKTAPSGWKNSVRHNLSLNKCFEKIENPVATGSQKKGCLWAMNPNKITKMDEEIAKWSKKDPIGIKKGMLMPENLEFLERGDMVKDYSLNPTATAESEDDEDPRTPTSISSQGSQGYDSSASSDFVDVEGFTVVPDSSMNELNIQASDVLFEDLDSGIQGQFFQGNYSISAVSGNQMPYNTLVFQKQGQKVFSV